MFLQFKKNFQRENFSGSRQDLDFYGEENNTGDGSHLPTCSYVRFGGGGGGCVPSNMCESSLPALEVLVNAVLHVILRHRLVLIQDRQVFL